MNIDIRQLKAFLAVTDEHSFTKAADKLHITQPTLSVIIKDLELALGVKLFDRTTRSVTPTATGLHLTSHARRLIKDLDRTVSEVQSFSSLERGNIKLAALPSIASSLAPKALASLNQLYPNIDITLKDCAADDVIKAIEEGEVDLGITVLTPELYKKYDVTPLLHDELLIVFPVTHPLANETSVTWDALLRDTLILMRTGTSVREVMDQHRAVNAHSLNALIEVAYMSSAIALVEAGLGVTILPSLGLTALPSSLTSCTLNAPTMTREIGLVQRKDRWTPPAVEVFKRLIIDTSRST
ncbi:LysR family transcriptional regulator [Neptunomonas phycophila]|uniref:LysR family transcriptional regulator n=1 Tax=Neptunomonas phycophila TaxID=1572645 RepID=A0AAW7XGJ2_9GAMM|nr:LysR family transcriptional regulator [Neptunomonas phycophila]MBT3145636.1 LysR family transcriptional regulator [Neptunomonas phycophila]MDO6453155.1 LysR family transcriptional regulator [Neptunomonas phycophila]MDP2523005.1 LysR family transcriptional regulator [Neptunomonas phycophila]